MNRSDRTYPTTQFGGVDADTEINGCELDGQFVDIVWMPASQTMLASPRPLILPLPTTIDCAEIDVGADDAITVKAEEVVQG